MEDHSACYCGDGHFADWGDTLDNIASFDVDAIAPGRGAALVGKDAVERATQRRLEVLVPRGGGDHETGRHGELGSDQP